MSYIPFISTFSRPIKRRKSHPGCKIAVSSHAPAKSFPLHPFVRSSKIRCTVSPTLMHSHILQNETQTFVSRLIRAPARDFSPTTNGTTARKAHRAKPKNTGSSPQEGIAGSSADETAFKLPPCSRKSRCSQRAPLQYTLLPSLRQPYGLKTTFQKYRSPHLRLYLQQKAAPRHRSLQLSESQRTTDR